MARAAAPLQWIALGMLALGLITVPWNLLLGGLAIALAALTALKLWEARSIRERRLVGLLQLLCAGLLAGIQGDLAGSLLQALATVLALAGLLALELGEGLGWSQLLRRSAQLLLAVLPMALVLFLLLPRLGPFTMLESGKGLGATTGLSDTLDPGSIAELSTNQEPAARVAFPQGNRPPPAGGRYWRVLVHERFDGRRWGAGEPQAATAAAAGKPPAGAAGTLQLWLVEPSGLAPVPWSGNARPVSPGLRIDRLGQLRAGGSATQRRVYELRDDGRRAGWRQLPPGPLDRQLPAGSNPRLEALGQEWGRLPTQEEKLIAAERWFRGQPFRYTLQPGTLPELAPLDAFLFERREGFCGHYASAFSALMRAAGVPARVVSGYRGGDWVMPLGGRGYLDIRQGDAHAWSEVWLPGEGWRSVDPSRWVPAPPEETGTRNGTLRWLEQQWWGVDLAWSRVWMGFASQEQEALLQRLLGERRDWLGGLVLVGLAGCLGGALVVLAALQRRSLQGDVWRRELERALAPLARRGLAPQPGETLPRFATRMEGRWPAVAEELRGFIALYQRHRFAPPGSAAAGGAERRELRQRRRRLAHLGRQLQRPPR
ncbi:MAG: DUF3488 and transglutaminase-like domain-containing protein [Synechococcaceae cyanobacterium]|nr:DUF3488 and transglutaminase-like domain-containing protein [Synechococcaceae cyanobacterium]